MINTWDMIELEFQGHCDKNPFVDYEIYGKFCSDNETKIVDGFYDGNGIYRVRFMPSSKGEYQYKIWGSFSDKEYAGSFMVEETQNYGMVRTDGEHFIYSDGSPYYPIGTTCYAWTNQTDKLQELTIETLRNSAFNKIRFCILPKHYDYNYRNPENFPYKGIPVDNSNINKYTFSQYDEKSYGNKWDFTEFNVDYFRIIEKDIVKLMGLGIEADIILFHPYDRWGFSNMPSDSNDLYIKYVVARFSAYRNVWWSLANEYDLCKHKTISDWEHYADLITSKDPYSHLISIHNCVKQYDFSKPWVTHCSIQRQVGKNELDNIPNWKKLYKKPIVIDEMCYEGNIEQYWGNISGQEMLRRMWKTLVLGGYPGHSECYFGENIWWSHGGTLKGESHKRISFLLKVLDECGRLHPIDYTVAENEDGTIKLQYFGEHRPCCKVFNFDENEYKVEIIDTWNMTLEEKGTFKGTVTIDLPQREYMAVRWSLVK